MFRQYDPFQLWVRTLEGARPRPQLGAMDARQEADRVVVEVDLPGVDPSSVDLTVDGDVLTLTAERAGTNPSGSELLVSERPQGKISRRLHLGESVDTEGIQARHHDGVLTITIPTAARARARRIEIGTGTGAGSGAAAEGAATAALEAEAA